jgi:hypothetical protein
MKGHQYALIGLMLLVFINSVSAYDTLLGSEGVGWKWPSSSWIDTPLGYIGLDYNNDYIYFQFEYAGNTSVEFNLYAYTTPADMHAFYCDSLNYSANTETWTRIRYITFNNSIDNTPLFEGVSNVGIWRCFYNSAPSQGNILISSTVSEVTYLSKDYSQRSFTAGNTYTVPLVNKYYPQYTLFTTVGYADTVVAYNASALYYIRYKPSCSLADNPLQAIEVSNANYSNVNSYQLTHIYANTTAIISLNISGKYPSGAVYASEPNSIINFSITTNNPSAVDAISWYKNGTLIQSLASNYSLSYVFAAGTYLVEAQLEDNDCGVYPTTNWTVTVGNSINLVGTIFYATTESYFEMPLISATVTVNKSGTTLASTSTDSNGAYSFVGLSAGTYTFTASKLGYSTFTKTLNLVYSSQNPTVYGQDATLNTSTQNGTWTVTVVDNLGNQLTDFNLVLYLGGEPILSIVNTSTIISQYGVTGLVSVNTVTIQGIPLGNTYYLMVSKTGYTDSIGLSQEYIYGQSFNGSNPTAASTVVLYYSIVTTTTIPPASISLTCTADTSIVDINCCLTNNQENSVTAIYLIPNQSESGATGFTGNIPYSTCFSVVTDLGASAYCGTTYYIHIDGYSTQTMNNVKTKNCDGTNVTTTVPVTSTTIPVPAGCHPNNYDMYKTCHIAAVGYGYASLDYNNSLISIACLNLIEYYYTTGLPIEGCLPTTTQPQIVNRTTIPDLNFDCTNLTGKIMDGDYFHASTCAFIKPLGYTYFFGLTMLAIVGVVYITLRSGIAAAIIALIYTSLFYYYLPASTVTILAIGTGMAILSVVLDTYLKNKEEEGRRDA